MARNVFQDGTFDKLIEQKWRLKGQETANDTARVGLERRQLGINQFLADTGRMGTEGRVEVDRGNLDVNRQNADTTRMDTTGRLANDQRRVDIAQDLATSNIAATNAETAIKRNTNALLADRVNKTTPTQARAFGLRPGDQIRTSLGMSPTAVTTGRATLGLGKPPSGDGGMDILRRMGIWTPGSF